MISAGEGGKLYFLSLPEDLFNDIGSRLDDKDLCKLEQASKALYTLLPKPCCTGTCVRRLDLISRERPLLQDEARSDLQLTNFQDDSEQQWSLA